MDNLSVCFEDSNFRGEVARQLINDFKKCNIRISKLAYRSKIVPSTLYKIGAGLARPSYKTSVELCSYYVKIFSEPQKYIFNDYYKDNQQALNKSLELAKEFIDFYV